MQIDSERMIPITILQKELTSRLRELTQTEEPLFVMRNNSLTAVILSPGEYEWLKEIESLLEHLEIANTIQQRLKHHERSQNVSWDRVKAEHDLSH